MASKTTPTMFMDLPVEIRLKIWDYAYEDTTPRYVEVTFHQALDQKCVKIYANPLPALLSVNYETRTHLESRFVKPFSSSLIAPDFQSLRSGEMSPETPSGGFVNIPIDLAKNQLCFRSDSDHWFFNDGESGEPKEYLHLFRLLFDEKYDVLVNNLAKLQVLCNIGFADLDDASAIKTHLPGIKEFTIFCGCHCMRAEPCAWFEEYAGEATEDKLKATLNGVALTFQFCCGDALW